MAASNPNSKHALPFIGRVHECELLFRLHAQHKHALIVGEEGMGKSALVEHLRLQLPLAIIPQARLLSDVCASLEAQLGLPAGRKGLIERKQVLLSQMATLAAPVVLDGVGWTSPKYTAFLLGISERVPLWLCTRSAHPWDIGHVWPLLSRFSRVELRAFQPRETHALVEAAVKRGAVPAAAMEVADWLHHAAGGNPGRLSKLLQALGKGHYDVRNPHSLRLLLLDYRIQEIWPARASSRSCGNSKGGPSV